MMAHGASTSWAICALRGGNITINRMATYAYKFTTLCKKINVLLWNRLYWNRIDMPRKTQSDVAGAIYGVNG